MSDTDSLFGDLVSKAAKTAATAPPLALEAEMDAQGLSIRALVRDLKSAMALCLQTGKVAWEKGPDGKHTALVAVPDLATYAKLLAQAGKWHRMEKPANEKTATQAGISFGNAAALALTDAERRGLVELMAFVESEAQKRGLSHLLSGDTESQDPKALSGVVGTSSSESPTSH